MVVLEYTRSQGSGVVSRPTGKGIFDFRRNSILISLVWTQTGPVNKTMLISDVGESEWIHSTNIPCTRRIHYYL